MFKNKLVICIIFLPLIIPIVLNAQTPIKIGVWEKFDARILKPENLFTNEKEKWDGKDNDKNGWIDDLHGISFDENEKLVTENFLPQPEFSAYYEHGTAVVSKIQEKCNVPFKIYGVGFEYTSNRLEKSGLLKLSVSERIKQLPEEYRSMEFFVKKSIEYFKKNKVQIVNISWGQNIEHIAEINPNFGETDQQRFEVAKDWIAKFTKYLEKYMTANPQIIFVVAAGNDGKSIDEIGDTPANITADNVIVVGGLNVELINRAEFSNFGKNIDCWAPSEKVEYIDINNKINEADGVSIAAPYVTGKIAELIYQGRKINKTNSRKIINKITTK